MYSDKLSLEVSGGEEAGFSSWGIATVPHSFCSLLKFVIPHTFYWVFKKCITSWFCDTGLKAAACTNPGKVARGRGTRWSAPEEHDGLWRNTGGKVASPKPNRHDLVRVRESLHSWHLFIWKTEKCVWQKWPVWKPDQPQSASIQKLIL